MEKTKEYLEKLIPEDILDFYVEEAQKYIEKFGEILKIPFSLNDQSLLIKIKP